MRREISIDNAIGFYFETNEAVPARLVARFLIEVDRLARLRSHFGRNTVVEIAEIRSGSVWADVLINGAALAAIIKFGVDISDRLTWNRPNPLSDSVSIMAENYSVVRVDIVTRTGTISVDRGDFLPRRNRSDKNSRRKILKREPDVGRGQTGKAILNNDAYGPEFRNVRLVILRGFDPQLARAPQDTTLMGTAHVVGSEIVFTAVSGERYNLYRGVGEWQQVPVDVPVVIRGSVVTPESGDAVLIVDDSFIASRVNSPPPGQ
ncbi:hypothetical protein FSZ31_04305 [Sphingorhabdus soli]|uniref:Uncharacterized protein n=1 Tax=Flavisphingopyxis soli TaxID=2601267 RepID=A0A5C6UM34_9SPHN|nr:hypothetical protein [Sphingorhabdus soli]TXC73949.1 hypothetical protein FSZ31_04305 [Sphingorhabdus soli]